MSNFTTNGQTGVVARQMVKIYKEKTQNKKI